ncbi:hypothetical protein FHG87_011520 [Trinorchestia longiramus]|nr:hypothetical protein FHG87_011520 [Trinorchestia longiramus]
MNECYKNGLPCMLNRYYEVANYIIAHYTTGTIRKMVHTTYTALHALPLPLCSDRVASSLQDASVTKATLTLMLTCTSRRRLNELGSKAYVKIREPISKNCKNADVMKSYTTIIKNYGT